MTQDWKAVATAIDQRLLELGLELRELARRSKVSESTLRELRYNSKQRRRSSRTLSDVSTGLEWPSDYLESVLTGSPTSDVGGVELDAVVNRLDAVDSRLDEMNSLLRQLSNDVGELLRTDRGERDAGR